jgi:hypothetical protein
MNAIEEIRKRMRHFPQAKTEITVLQATVFPLDETGFQVSLTRNSTGCMVSFDGWHANYEDEADALNVFAFGLSQDCRLQVHYRGDFAHIWKVEEKSKSGEWVPCEWVGANEAGLIAPPLFWVKKRVVYLQNQLIESE